MHYHINQNTIYMIWKSMELIQALSKATSAIENINKINL